MIQFKRVLVPIDFSKNSCAAADHALHLADKFDAELFFVHVVSGSPYAMATFDGGFYAGQAWTNEETLKVLSRELDALVGKIAPNQKSERLVVEGDVVQQIKRIAEERGVDLVVLSTHGYGPFRRFLLGSVTAKLLHDLDCPIFTGAHVEEPTPFDPNPYRRIACAVDLREGTKKLLSWAADFAAVYGADLYVLHGAPAFEPALAGPYLPADLPEKLKRRAEEAARDLIKEERITAEVFVENLSPDIFVPGISKEKDVDLLIVGRHSDGGFIEQLSGHTYALIRQSHCPVISV